MYLFEMLPTEREMFLWNAQAEWDKRILRYEKLEKEVEEKKIKLGKLEKEVEERKLKLAELKKDSGKAL